LKYTNKIKLPQLVSTWEQISNNLKTLEGYRQSEETKDDYIGFLKRGVCFLVYEEDEINKYAPSRFIGYVDNSIEKHRCNNERDGRETNKAISIIIKCEPKHNEELEHEYIKFCYYNGFKPNMTGAFGAHRKYWFIKNKRKEL